MESKVLYQSPSLSSVKISRKYIKNNVSPDKHWKQGRKCQKKIENNIQNNVGVEKMLGKFVDGRLNIDGTLLKEVSEAPYSKNNETAAEVQASIFYEKFRDARKKIATLTT